jgi:hypothetical protein
VNSHTGLYVRILREKLKKGKKTFEEKVEIKKEAKRLLSKMIL